MAPFTVGERVERTDQRPNDCGTIIEILSEGPAGASYAIDWDNHPGVGPCPEIALVPCGCRDASGDVLIVLGERPEPLSEHQIADILKSKHDAKAVHEALLYWKAQGEAMQVEPDALWTLTHSWPREP
jgi:hypothetical protein